MAETVVGHSSQDNLLDRARGVPVLDVVNETHSEAPVSPSQGTPLDQRDASENPRGHQSRPRQSSFGPPTSQHVDRGGISNDQQCLSRPPADINQGNKDVNMQPMYAQHLRPPQCTSMYQGMNRSQQEPVQMQQGPTEGSNSGAFPFEPRQRQGYYSPYPISSRGFQGYQSHSGPNQDCSYYGHQEPCSQGCRAPTSPYFSQTPRQGAVEFYQPKSYAGVDHLKASQPEYPIVNKRAFLVLSIIQAICSLLILISGIAVAASNVPVNGPAVGTVSVLYSILCGVSITFGILNYKTTTECRVITGLAFSVLSSIGSLGPLVLGMTNALVCSKLRFICPGHVTGFSCLLVFLSLVVSVVGIVHSSFSCRAMCCLPPQRVIMTATSTNNNVEEHTTKM